MNYYKRYWDETTGEELTDSWGTSTYYFEAGSDNIVLRQIQVFQNGKGLKYWTEFTEDDYGMISDQPLDPDDFEQHKIERTEFEKAWTIDYKRQNSVWALAAANKSYNACRHALQQGVGCNARTDGEKQLRFRKDFFEIDGIYNIPGFVVCSGQGYGFYTYCCKSCGEIFTVDEQKLEITKDLNEIAKNKTCPTCQTKLIGNLAKYPENIFYKGTVYRNRNTIDYSRFSEAEILETYVL